MRIFAPVVLVASLVLVAAAPSARAAVARGAALACRDIGDIKRAFRAAPDKKGKDDKGDKGDAAYFKGRLGAGDCVQLVRDQKVLVDQRDGVFWCVRPAGALDCYWTYEKAIDLYPAPPLAPGEKRGKPKR